MSIETSIIFQIDSNGKESLKYVVSQETSSLYNALPLAKHLKERNPEQNVVIQLWSDQLMNWEIYDDEFMMFSMNDAYREDLEADVYVFVVVQYGNGDGDTIVEVVVDDEKKAKYLACSEKQEWKYWTMRIEVWRAGRRVRVISEEEMGIKGTDLIYENSEPLGSSPKFMTVRGGL